MSFASKRLEMFDESGAVAGHAHTVSKRRSGTAFGFSRSIDRNLGSIPVHKAGSGDSRLAQRTDPGER
jgi:hypothetical protein